MQKKEIVPADQMLPDRLLIIPTTGKPVFPGIFTPMMIDSEQDIAVVDKSLSENSFIGLLLIKDDENQSPTADEMYRVGTVGKIVKKINLPDGGINIFISTLKRFKVKKFLSSTPFSAAVEYLKNENDDTIEVKALTRTILEQMKRLSEDNPLFSEEIRLSMVNINEPGRIADFFCSILNIERTNQQEILETLDVQKRLESVLIHVKKEQELMKIKQKIQKQINEKIEKNQREYFLKEELKAIKDELGMPSDARTDEYKKFKEAIKKFNFSGEIKEQMEHELEKFNLMEPNSAEFVVTRNYLDTIVSLPWNPAEREDYEIKKAAQILDRDHYGLEDVKKRILEYLAVRKLKGDNKGSIICLIGAPGVGKTSVGKSIASALNKKFFRFSVGGMRDEAEIKGHRRTYVGAMPGKIIQGLKIVKTNAPVFMIDEIDKLGSSYQGDPSSALLEVLDPEQNFAFRDHYLDLPFDISNILFIATANSLDTIPRPLIDRMEVIRLSGYIEKEKTTIAKKYLIPKSLKKTGLKKTDIKYSPKALSAIAVNYAREAGMRNYEKALDKIHRKLAHKIVLNETEPPFIIEPENLEEYLGKPLFREDEVKVVTQPGTAVGLAWTNFGGDTLMIEAIEIPGKEGLKLTGQMGKVMEESANIAYSYTRHIAEKYGASSDFFNKNIIHLHIPEGATPKDGPSAGITMASALLSLSTGKKLKKKLAMTGELSLIGKVLPIGGLKEKTIAARRAGIKTILIPKANERDLSEMPDHIKKGINFISVETMEDVIENIF